MIRGKSEPAIPLGPPPWTPEIAEETEHLYERLRDFVPALEWRVHAPYIHAIEVWKRERNAIVLAHNYQTPEIFHGVADRVGDSLGLARLAAATDADVIVLAGVYFMAETANLLNPNKTVLIPDAEAGCSLAASITGADVRLLRERYPDVPVVTYVNTSAEVKAESDICCTSSNAVKVVESLGTERVIFLPDEYLGRWVSQQTNVDVILWKGHCEVHERFTAEELLGAREQYGKITILAHPECPPMSSRKRFRRLDVGDEWVRFAAEARKGSHGDRVLDERQCPGRQPVNGIHSSLQSLPAHEAHHPSQNPSFASDADA